MDKNQHDAIVKGILQGDPKTLQDFYNKHFNSVKHYIRIRGGTLEDAEDVFQDGVVFLYTKLKENTLVLTSSPGTYFIGVCKGIWSNRLRKKNLRKGTDIDGRDLLNIADDPGFTEAIEKQERFNLFQKNFQKLSVKCKEILQLVFQKNTAKDIAKQLNNSEGYIKKKSFECKKKLTELVREDPLYVELSTSNFNH